MQRFLIVLALVAVAGATYVAAAPGSQTAGPTATQFNALKREVAVLQRRVGNIHGLVRAHGRLLNDCMATGGPITRRGDWQDENQTFGYSYSDPTINSGTPFLTTALDVTAPDDPTAIWITGGGPRCGADIGYARRKVGAGFRSHRLTPQFFSAHRH